MKKNILYESVSNVNDLDTLNEMKNKFISLCEKREKELNVIAEAKNLNTNSFLFIKESFANLCPSLIKTKKGVALIKKYVKEHKENKDLQKMFNIYENITSIDSTVNVETFVNEMKTMVGDLDFDALNEGISRLNTILKQGYIEVGEEAKNAVSVHNNRVLDESVNYVFGNTKKLDNMARYNLCVNEIKKFVAENKINPLSFKNNTNLDNLVEEFNNRFSADIIGERNFAIIKEIHECENKSEIFEKYKNECINKINEAINANISQETCNQLVEFRTRLTKKEYNPETLGMDIANFIELGETVSE